MTKLNVLITGGAGFIGSHTAMALKQHGFNVRILDLLDPQIHGSNPTFSAKLTSDFECLKGDVRDPADVKKALNGIDIVYHFAALTGVGQSMTDMNNYISTNVSGTANLFEQLVKGKRKIKKIVLASSRAVYGEGTHTCATCGVVYPSIREKNKLTQGDFRVYCPVCKNSVSPCPTQEERPLIPGSLYGISKKQQEEIAQYAARTFHLPVICLRYFNVYGSGQSLLNPYTGIVSIFYSRIMAEQPISIYEKGTPLRDFIHIHDVTRANLMVLNSKTQPGDCLNIGTGKNITIPDVAKTLARACGQNVQLKDRGEFRVGDINACTADLTKAKNILGFHTTVSLHEGLIEFVKWAKAQQFQDGYSQSVKELELHGLFGKGHSK